MTKEPQAAQGKSNANPTNAMGKANSAAVDTQKKLQLAIILENNPADDVNMPGHTWIRSVGDILTYQEAVDDDGYGLEDGYTPDFKASDVQRALKTGEMTVYSSKPIRDGIFVTPSKMEAQSYAGGSKVYSQTVKLSDVAWIDGLQGQYAKVKRK